MMWTFNVFYYWFLKKFFSSLRSKNSFKQSYKIATNPTLVANRIYNGIVLTLTRPTLANLVLNLSYHMVVLSPRREIAPITALICAGKIASGN
jgi:hypothetical protein